MAAAIISKMKEVVDAGDATMIGGVFALTVGESTCTIDLKSAPGSMTEGAPTGRVDFDRRGR